MKLNKYPLLFLVFLFSLFIFIFFIPVTNIQDEKIISIKRGSSLGRITKILKKNKIIGSTFSFKIISYAFGASQSLKSGEYIFKPNDSLYDILKKLKNGRTVLISITVPEGYNAEQIFSLLEENGIGSKQKYRMLNRNRAFLKTIPFSKKLTSLEGFLFPETYFFSKHAEEKLVLLKMVNTFFSKLPKNYEKLSKKVNLSAYEAITLASIIEKETSVGAERILISSVFHNRLIKRMPLATDPTVIYGIKNYKGNLTRKHLRQKTPYNTYRMRGLTPTPISNPGLESIMAAVNPDKSKFLYFVAMGNGKHKFSKTYREHNNAVNYYQRRRRKKSKDYRSY